MTLAAQGGYEDLVRLLLERGAYIEHRDNKGYTPLINAAINGHREVVRLLLDRHAKLEEQSDRTKDTALSLACSGGRYEVAELLLQRCANKVSGFDAVPVFSLFTRTPQCSDRLLASAWSASVESIRIID